MEKVEQDFEAPCHKYYKIFNTNSKEDEGYEYRFLSPFEFKNVLLDTGIKGVGKDKMLNAGRGNPNFYCTTPRIAFSLLNTICTEIGTEGVKGESWGVMPPTKKLWNRVMKKVNKLPKSKECRFLKKAIRKMHLLSKMSKDDFMHDLVISTQGTFYPSPSRCQKFAEPSILEFLDKNVYRSKKPLREKTDLFVTEGASAAIIYVFNTLSYNEIINAGDTIGLITPIFSPYLEVPDLNNYRLEQLCVESNVDNDWGIPEKEFQKIAEIDPKTGKPKMKALFFCNPGNPSSMALPTKNMKKLARFIKKNNPNLVILTDNVYAPFVDEYESIFNLLPKNTIAVYSYSKYFGTTGWRLGTIMVNKSNIFDSKNGYLRNASETVNNRYKVVSTDPQKIKLIDRLLMDSRQVAEGHTAGLSTPQQVIMCLFGMYDMMDTNRVYYHQIKDTLKLRMDLLTKPINYTVDEGPRQTNYYVILNILNIAAQKSKDFKEYVANRDPLEFLIKLAATGVILLPALGFAGDFWGVRASLANLETEKYSLIGQKIQNMVDVYYNEFLKVSKSDGDEITIQKTKKNKISKKNSEPLPKNNFSHTLIGRT